MDTALAVRTRRRRRRGCAPQAPDTGGGLKRYVPHVVRLEGREVPAGGLLGETEACREAVGKPPTQAKSVVTALRR